MNFKLPSLPSLPEDEDARNIVVRVISYEYYLKKFWLTFIDPYIEVEYQIAIRRQRLIKVCLLSIYCIIYGIHMISSPLLYNFPSDEVIVWNIEQMLYIFGSLWIILGILSISAAYIKNINNIINLPIIMTTLAMFIAIIFITLNLRLLYSTPDDVLQLPQIGKDLYKFQSQLGTGLNNTYTIYCINILLILLFSITILDVKQFLAFTGAISIIWSFMIYLILNLSNTDFRELYDTIGWKIGSLYITEVSAGVTANANSNFTQPQPPFVQQLENVVKMMVPYEKSIFYIEIYNSNLAKYYIFLWLSFVIIMLYFVYNNEKMLRADFILRRVRSDKDEPRNLEIGIKIKNLNETSRTEEENLIFRNNLKRWKESDSSSNDKEINNNLNEKQTTIDVKESTIDVNMDLYELGSVLDGKTVNSFISDTSFKRNKTDIIKSVEKIIPKSYTKSEISDNNNSAINDTQSDSHMC